MIVVRFKVQCQPEKTDQVRAAFEEVITPSRALDGVISFDIARDLADPDSFIATEVFEDQAALERQESLPPVGKTLALLEESPCRRPRGNHLPRLLFRAARRLRNSWPLGPTPGAIVSPARL